MLQDCTYLVLLNQSVTGRCVDGSEKYDKITIRDTMGSVDPSCRVSLTFTFRRPVCHRERQRRGGFYWNRCLVATCLRAAAVARSCCAISPSGHLPATPVP